MVRWVHRVRKKQEESSVSTLVLVTAFCLCTGNLCGQSASDTLRILIKAIPGMQYDLVRFTARPGSYIRLVLTNADDMEHNLVIGKKDSRQKIVDAALALGKDGPGLGYIPKTDLILGSIPILKVGQADSITFRVPRNTGVYPYVCTYPGHGGIMYGAMHVTNGVMPEITADLNVPEHRRKAVNPEKESGHRPTGHPYPLVPPYYYRVLLPDAGPAAIAVCLPDHLAYCWDAGSCRLRYAWTGEFLDLTDYWTIKGELHAKILGSIFYRDRTEFPFQLKEDTTNHGKNGIALSVKFKGYRLVNGYPEFNYMVDAIEVFELILSQKEGNGLVRQFKMKGPLQALWFIHAPGDGANYQSDKGKWTGNRLKLEPQETASFTITMTKSLE